MSQPLLEMKRVHKRFLAVHALRGVDLAVLPGEVHALVGENGAGKSTLMKVLSGALQPDAGEMTFGGAAYRPSGPLSARALGVAMIYQELNLAPDLSVAENILLGREPHRAGWVRRDAARARATEVLTRLGHGELSPDRRVAELGPGQRQLVEIARALADRARIVVMDEPTSSLSAGDSERLFEVVARLRADGVSVIYISHFLEELARVADRYTVLRDGLTVTSGSMAEATPGALIAHMVGRSLDELYPQVPHERGPEVLSLDALCGAPLPRAVSLSLHRGEILGLAGLIGAGRSELLRAVFGLAPVRSGRVRVAGVWDRGRPPWQRLMQGVGLLSEDRKQEGLAQSMSIADNVTLSHLGQQARLGFVDRKAQRARVARHVQQLSIAAGAVSDAVATLSGGNQQKVALARLLDLDVDVLLLDEPTRGIDVASKAAIYRVMGELAAQGKALLFVSSYIPELLGVCDRIAVMHRGTLAGPWAASETSAARVMAAATQGTVA